MKRKRKKASEPISWLPIDSRLVEPIFHFGNVRGVAKTFLQVEITLAVLVVVSTLVAAGIRVVEAVIK